MHNYNNFAFDTSPYEIQATARIPLCRKRTIHEVGDSERKFNSSTRNVAVSDSHGSSKCLTDFVFNISVKNLADLESHCSFSIKQLHVREAFDISTQILRILRLEVVTNSNFSIWNIADSDSRHLSECGPDLQLKPQNS